MGGSTTCSAVTSEEQSFGWRTGTCQVTCISLSTWSSSCSFCVANTIARTTEIKEVRNGTCRKTLWSPLLQLALQPSGLGNVEHNWFHICNPSVSWLTSCLFVREAARRRWYAMSSGMAHFCFRVSLPARLLVLFLSPCAGNRIVQCQIQRTFKK